MRKLQNRKIENESAVIPLSSLGIGTSAFIIGFADKKQNIFLRLLELGFTTGSRITACGKAPFGNPLIFTIHGGKLALRKEEAECVLVKIV